MAPKTKREIVVVTRGRGFHEITGAVRAIVTGSGCRDGVCVLFCPHTSAGLLVQENADRTVLVDLEAWLARLAPDGSDRYAHDAEGPDDMAAHLRTVLTGCSLSIPVGDGALLLGRWQGIYLVEHRLEGRRRSVHVRLVDCAA